MRAAPPCSRTARRRGSSNRCPIMRTMSRPWHFSTPSGEVCPCPVRVAERDHTGKRTGVKFTTKPRMISAFLRSVWLHCSPSSHTKICTNLDKNLKRATLCQEKSHLGDDYMPSVISVVNQKGGVGKTTTVVHLSSALARLGYPVLVVDLDSQANVSTTLGLFDTYELN